MITEVNNSINVILKYNKFHYVYHKLLSLTGNVQFCNTRARVIRSHDKPDSVPELAWEELQSE